MPLWAATLGPMSARFLPRSRLLVAVLLLIPALCRCGGGGGERVVDGGQALAHAAKILELGPRPAGSKNLTAAATYLKQVLRDRGLEPQEQIWSETVKLHGKEQQVKFQNVWAQVPGKDPVHGPVVILSAHYDSKLCSGHPDPAHNFEFVGALDAAGSVGVLLELSRHLAKRDNTVNFWLVFFDGEESLEYDWNDQLALFGSRHFVRTMSQDKQRFPNGLSSRLRAMVLLDLIGDKIQKIDRDKASTTELVELFRGVATEMGEADRMYRYESEFKDDHIPFVDYGIPAIDLIDFVHRVPAGRRKDEPPEIAQYEAWWHTRADTLDKLSPDSLAFVGNLVWNALPKLEQFATKGR